MLAAWARSIDWNLFLLREYVFYVRRSTAFKLTI